MQLLSSYNSLGKAALENCRDKFLVQSIAVDRESERLSDYDALTTFWSQVGNTTALANKKLHVRHKVSDGSRSAPAPPARPNVNINDMNHDQLVGEVQSLRRKYDELVAFSVNLTAERDLLNNSLESIKRDLTNEKNKKRNTVVQKQSPWMLIFVAILCLIAGSKVQQFGYLKNIPGLGKHFDQKEEL